MTKSGRSRRISLRLIRFFPRCCRAGLGARELRNFSRPLLSRKTRHAIPKRPAYRAASQSVLLRPPQRARPHARRALTLPLVRQHAKLVPTRHEFRLPPSCFLRRVHGSRRRNRLQTNLLKVLLRIPRLPRRSSPESLRVQALHGSVCHFPSRGSKRRNEKMIFASAAETDTSQ